jgi:DNA-directed RNA polymerase subunit H (RpoH/RPB5)
MALSSNRILTIYKSRMTLLEQLQEQGYNTGDYDNFSINEIDIMYANDQLDMLVSRKTDGKKVYVKYLLNIKQLRKDNLDQLIEDLFEIETVLEKKDTLIVVTNEEPNDTIINKVKYLFDHSGIFIVIRYIKRLQFNILKHQLVPKATILQDDEAEALKTKFHMKTLQQLPEISRFDPHALSLSLRPGQVILIERKSNTAMTYEYYRICV